MGGKCLAGDDFDTLVFMWDQELVSWIWDIELAIEFYREALHTIMSSWRTQYKDDLYFRLISSYSSLSDFKSVEYYLGKFNFKSDIWKVLYWIKLIIILENCLHDLASNISEQKLSSAKERVIKLKSEFDSLWLEEEFLLSKFSLFYYECLLYFQEEDISLFDGKARWDILLQLWYLNLKRRDSQRAIYFFLRSIPLIDSSNHLCVFINLWFLYLETWNLERAFSSFKRALELCPADDFLKRSNITSFLQEIFLRICSDPTIDLSKRLEYFKIFLSLWNLWL